MKTTVALVAAALAALAADAATTTCNGACPENLKPLCASDGVTYDNECMFEFAKCEAANAGKTPALTLVSAGRCPASATPAPSPAAACAKDFACLQVIDPVCGTDGKTYNSACELKQVQCSTSPTLKVKSKGECPSNNGSSSSNSTGATCATTLCTKEYKPVCGSDNKTYSNKCEFTNAQCKATGGAKLTLKSESACDAASSVGGDSGASKPSASNSSSAGASNNTVGGCTTACTKEIAAVCGSDGVTYNNPCLLKNARCANATLTQVASTACETSTKSAAASIAYRVSAVATACALVLGIAL